MANWYEYCVIFRKGGNRGIRHYRNSSAERISLAMAKVLYCPGKITSKITSNSDEDPKAVFKEFPNAKISFREGYVGSLKIEIDDERMPDGLERFLSLIP